MLDVISPALFIGQSIGRMANLLNGDAFGAPLAVISVSSIPSGPWPAAPMETRPYGRQKSGKDRLMSSFLRCSSYSSPGLTNAASAAFFTSCSTRRCAFSLNSSAAIMWSLPFWPQISPGNKLDFLFYRPHRLYWERPQEDAGLEQDRQKTALVGQFFIFHFFLCVLPLRKGCFSKAPQRQGIQIKSKEHT